MITVRSPLWVWNGGKGSWHFLTVPAEQAAEIRVATLGPRTGFGSVRVKASIGDVIWRTSIFPQREGGYLLPVKAEVRRRAGISPGDEVTFTLDLL